MQLSATPESFEETNKSEAKAATFDLGSKGSLTSPKLKELATGTKLLCIIRSSNTQQPINMFKLYGSMRVTAIILRSLMHHTLLSLQLDKTSASYI